MDKITLKIGLGSCGIAAGAEELVDFISTIPSQAERINPFPTEVLYIEILKTGCIGMCFAEPIVEIVGEYSIIYGNVTPKILKEIISYHLRGEYYTKNIILTNNQDLQKYAVESETIFQQKRIVLRNCGIINPESIEEYIKSGGYNSLQKIIKQNESETIITDIMESGLRGRGGGGFPTGLKWKLTREVVQNQLKSDNAYIICNADEGDPGAFMDRSILEGDPHTVIEGMIIAGFAIGANTGYFYVRAEYPLAIKHLQIAIDMAYQRNYLGKNILGSDFHFDLYIKEGAGAFVCGEETALMASIEGKRGMPKLRPPYPSQSGLWKYPTNINNVETYANIPYILADNQEEKFTSLGTEKSKGTKVFALAGKIKKSGLIEVPMGISLRDIIFKIGGGMKKDRPFKAVQLGGPSGGCIPESLLDTPVDYESLVSTGAIMGSGGMIVMDTDTCMVDVARYFLSFIQNESCGKCTFCRIGTRRMLEILTKITKGLGELSDINILQDLAINISQSSLCGLGQTAANPVLTTLKYFRNEYEEHIISKKCPAKVCKALIKYEIIPEKCVGCTLCQKTCPIKCINGVVKQPHVIDQEKCIKCGMCAKACKFEAIGS